MAKKRARARKTSRFPLFGWAGGKLDQRSLDLIGLALGALAIYFCFILYFGFDGGQLGSAVGDGLAHLLGIFRYLVPFVLGGVAVVLVFHPDLPSSRPVWPGLSLLALGLLLTLAGGTLGLLGGRSASDGFFDPNWYPDHGGLFGESLYWVTGTLLQPIGAHLIGLVAIVAGLLLLTGATLAGVLAGGRAGVSRARGATGGVTAKLGGGDLLASLDRLAGLGRGDDVTRDLESVEDGAGAEGPLVWAGDGDTDQFEAFDEFGVEPSGGSADETGMLPDEELPPGAETEVLPDRGEAQLPLTPMGETRGATVASGQRYVATPGKVLAKSRKEVGPRADEQEGLARKLVETLGHFGVEAKVVGVVTGPHVSRYELQLAPGTKVKKVTELSNDLAYALASTDIRILAPIPGKQAVGVEVPNASRRMVRLGEIYDRPGEGSSPLLAWLGKGIDGKPVSTDLASMPHVLVAGTTGSGKSGCVNAILSSILMHSSPNDVRLVLVDPKQVELNHYESVPHLLTPVVTNPKLAANVLSNLIAEMETRYELMREARTRNIADYNAHQSASGGATLPHILCVIDELADLMMVAPADVEASIIRLAQKSRATGIHLVLATQRPSTDIITGTIKVNIPSRIAFAVSSQTDSRVILDQGGAEALLGQGDMLFREPGSSKLSRIQGAFVSEAEIARITEHWAAQGEPEFHQELLEKRDVGSGGQADDEFDPDSDELLDQAVTLVVETGTASVSMIQRRLRVGYTRAGRLIDMLERRGVISGYEGSKPRQVLITEAQLPSFLSTSEEDPESPGETSPGEGVEETLVPTRGPDASARPEA